MIKALQFSLILFYIETCYLSNKRTKQNKAKQSESLIIAYVQCNWYNNGKYSETGGQDMQKLSKKTECFTDSVIRRMTRIAYKYDSINLSQGFPDCRRAASSSGGCDTGTSGRS